MLRRTSLRTTRRASTVPLPAQHAWAVVACGLAGPRWYVDAGPLVVRGLIDRLAGGGGRRWPVPDRPELLRGDTAGFWRVWEVQDDPGAGPRRLVLVADVRSPGRVTLTTTVTPTGAVTCRIEQQVRLDPDGLLGAAYLLVDLPARETVAELVHRRLLHDVLRDR
ncbi:DUF2867 domain-containing protein [Nocardioides marmotae]|uniref:DUF2867 domain-containing protein n=1 Tax=Nocardioides marmotae TaxID=2663857 RepID=A0A6I3JFG6_9ACTN|nr:DUF2867 domain-containing protein [Nocardioides marmotae]MCR6033212.1 DUF2867 domain-containing protein [Gordonia jinghuaiqii]MBC9732718.1 DUF2867 domain-containing protein [Nocardioides marmotae]MTB83835.1 DUF2867 domain-containing protein [Nocardioides marmotae]MTB96867.1 DUF2867 domain-containing protein [Nocardioides marmotae]QKE02942.1 DUF2867 domain-containing protein [Nocardioides marmotae]